MLGIQAYPAGWPTPEEERVMGQSLPEDKPLHWRHKTDAYFEAVGRKETAYQVGRGWLEALVSSWEPVLGEKMMCLPVEEGSVPSQQWGRSGP